jgi:hypothetical protein
MHIWLDQQLTVLASIGTADCWYPLFGWALKKIQQNNKILLFLYLLQNVTSEKNKIKILQSNF